MNRSKKTGFTIVELIITLVIVALLFGTGYMYMSGYLPKQRLNTNSQAMSALLQRTQSRAQTKGSKFGIHFVKSGSDSYACSFKDCSGDFKPSNCDANCENCSDCTVSTCDATNCSEMTNEKWRKFSHNVYLFDCSTASAAEASDALDTIVFDIRGFAYNKTQALTNFEIFLKRDNTGVREIEVNSSGLIELIKLGNAGNIAGQANEGTCK